MTHNTTVNQQTFDELTRKVRHLSVRHNPLFMPGDTLTVSLEDSRDQLIFEIITIDALNTRQDILGLYAPYKQPAQTSMAAPLPGADTLHY